MRSCQRFAAPLVVRVLGQEVSAPLPAVVLSAVRTERLQLYRRSLCCPDLQRCSSLLVSYRPLAARGFLALGAAPAVFPDAPTPSETSGSLARRLITPRGRRRAPARPPLGFPLGSMDAHARRAPA